MSRDLVVSVLAAQRAVWLAAPAPPGGAGSADDPFRLDLPPLVEPGSTDIDAATLEALGGLYLAAELEQTGLLVAAELLIANRASLDLTSVEAAELLDQLAQASQDWLTATARQQLFARVFGTAPGGNELVNREFPQLLSDLCSAVAAYDQAEVWNSPPPSYLRSQLTRVVQRLRANLALRRYGSTLVAGRRIVDQVRRSVELVGHPGILQLVHGRSAWDVVRATWEPSEQPDIEALVGQAQAGQVVIAWTGAPDALTGVPPQQVREAAATWLLHAGLDPARVA
jgi:hypothetical protein